MQISCSFQHCMSWLLIFIPPYGRDRAARLKWGRNTRKEIGKRKRDTEKCDAVMETDVLCIWTIGNSMWSVWFMPVDLIHEYFLFTSAVKHKRQMWIMFCLKMNRIMCPSHMVTQGHISRVVPRAMTKRVLPPLTGTGPRHMIGTPLPCTKMYLF